MTKRKIARPKTLAYRASKKPTPKPKTAAAPTTLGEAEALVKRLKDEEGRRRGEYASRAMVETAAADRVNLRLSGKGLTTGDRIMTMLTSYREHTAQSDVGFAALMAANTIATELHVIHGALEGYREMMRRLEGAKFDEDGTLHSVSYALKNISARLRAAPELLHDIHRANKVEGGGS